MAKTSKPELPMNTPVPWNWGGKHFVPGDDFFLLGSCFAQEFQGFLREKGQNSLVNPFGPAYNPISMAVILRLLLESQPPQWQRQLFTWKGLWRHPLAHTLLARSQESQALEELTDAWEKGRKALLHSRGIILTFGTATVWEKKETLEVWSNCHTLPQGEFSQRMMGVQEVIDSWSPLIQVLKSLGKEVFLTLSPVRYLKSDPQANSLSKAVLRCALGELAQEAVYFPSYEIMTDELRDYRWYAPDMVHPSPQAARYIAGRFWEKIAGPELQEMGEIMEGFLRRFRHRPLHAPSTDDTSALESDWEEIRHQYPFLSQDFRQGVALEIQDR